MASSETEIVIDVRKVVKEYVMGDSIVHALRGVDLTIRAGEMVAIMGPSGSGKSTFMNLLGCLDRPTSGEYFLNNELVAKMTDDELAGIRNRYIGFVFQNFHLLARTPAIKSVELPMVYAGAKNRHERAKAAMERVGLGHRLNNKPSELSGGQQQRVAIARAIVNDPVLLLCDEPTGNLDSHTSEEIMALFTEFNDLGKTVVIVTHEEEIAHHCKRIVRFKDGWIVQDSPVLDRIDPIEVLKSMPNQDEEPAPAPTA